jgi:murein tripeptide amidase MpaA
MYGHIDLVTIDYLEKIQPISNYQYKPSEERERRKLLADQMKNIALEFKTRILTATQASTIEASQWNDPNFVMTRFNISEVKALVDPFSFVFTLNQTGDEYESRYMRIYGDKIRNYPAKQTIGIYQAYHFEKFYDRKKTINELSSVKLSNGKVSPIILAKLKNNEK